MRGREVAAGEEWAGSQRLLARLETELGIGSRAYSPSERAACLVPGLSKIDGYWSESFKSDALATSKRLLVDRDLLAMWGWQGESAGPRLDSLWRATREALPGIPDRLRGVLCALETRRPALAAIVTRDAVDELPTLWRKVFAALERKGVRITAQPEDLPKARGDLEAARTAPFVPSNDGSLELLRAHGPLAAAEEIAGSLASCDRLDGVVIIGRDALLNDALTRHGLPCIGSSRGPTASSPLLRLVLETAFHPVEPEDLHALLIADPGPVPRRIARRLLSAFAAYPARGSAIWDKTLVDALETVEPDRRTIVADRLAALLMPEAPRDGTLTLSQVSARVRALSVWARGRSATDSTIEGVVGACTRFIDLAHSMGIDGFTRIQLQRLCDEIGDTEHPGAPAEVGLDCVDTPGAIAAPARVIIWWNFTRSGAPTPLRLRLTVEERRRLLESGVVPPDPGAGMAAEARRWRRPLLFATEALLLSCPLMNVVGDRENPHPLWDEIVASMPDSDDASTLVCTQVRQPALTRRSRVELRHLPHPFAEIRVAGPVTLTGEASPSSIEHLIGCSLSWFLERVGRVRAGVASPLSSPGPLLFGNLAHHVLARVFADGRVSEESAIRAATEVFESEIKTFSEALLLPDHQAERAEVKLAIVATAREIALILDRTGAEVRGVELPLTGMLGRVSTRGRADMLLTSPDIVIDFKWGTSKYRDRLEAGTALQLAAYAELARSTSSLPGVAYLSLRTQALLAAPPSVLPSARTPGVYSVDEMVAAAVAALEARLAELSSGSLFAPAALADFDRETISNGAMQLAPPCEYCGCGSLCGRRLRP